MKDVNVRNTESSDGYRSGTVLRGTVCGKSARTGLWGSGEVTNRSTRSPFSAFSAEPICYIVVFISGCMDSVQSAGL